MTAHSPRRIPGASLQTLVGEEVACSDWLPVTQAMIDAFASVTGDHQWIHVDVERARRESGFGETIAHGFLTMSLLTRLFESTVIVDGFRSGLNYGFNRLRFTGPVRAGSRIRGRFTLAALEVLGPEGGRTAGVQLTWRAVIEVEGDSRPALVADWITRRYE